MKISDKQFEDLLQSIPSIEVELEFEGEQGFASETEHEVYVNGFFLDVDFIVRESGHYEPATQYTPDAFISSGKSAFVSYVTIHDEEGDEVDLSDEQVQTISKNLESNLENS